MAAKSPISLVNFFVYNVTLGVREGEEHEKILYYSPPETDIDTQIKNVGLSEAIVKFTETFNPEKPCESLHTQKTRQLFYQPEPDYWIVMTISIPCNKKQKDGQTHIEFHSEEVQNRVYLTAVKQSYQMFKLFVGTFTHIFQKSGVEIVKTRLEHFFSRYLPTLKLNNCDFMDVISGIQFLPLDKNTFLKIQCFINRLESMFSNVLHTVFLYNDHLVWSGLAQDDIQILYKYLVTSLFPNYLETELQIGTTSPARPSAAPFSPPHYGKFISGPPNVNDPTNMGKVKKVWVNVDKDQNKECHLIIYRALSATVCLFVESIHQLEFEFFKSLDSYLGPDLTNLASTVSEQYSKRLSSSVEPHYKFIYFNRMNLAQKSTIHADNKKTGNINVPVDIMKLITDLHTDLCRVNDAGEVIVKTMSDCWVVGKMSDQREFYVVLNQKNADIIEIHEEVKKLCSSQFNNIFFYE